MLIILLFVRYDAYMYRILVLHYIGNIKYTYTKTIHGEWRCIRIYKIQFVLLWGRQLNNIFKKIQHNILMLTTRTEWCRK